MSDFIPALNAEIAALERDISNNPDPRVLKLAELRRVRSLYVHGPVKTLSQSEVKPGGLISLAMRTSEPSTHQRILAETASLLGLWGEIPTPLGEIYDHLVKRGINIGGKTPKNTLSAVLSNSDLFEAHGRSGWTLARSKEKEATDDLLSRAPSVAPVEPPLATEGTHE